MSAAFFDRCTRRQLPAASRRANSWRGRESGIADPIGREDFIGASIALGNEQEVGREMQPPFPHWTGGISLDENELGPLFCSRLRVRQRLHLAQADEFRNIARAV